MGHATTPADCAPLRVQHPCCKETCSGETVALETPHATEIYIRCAPALSPGEHDDFESQARRFYGCLPSLLARAGADAGHVVLERVFFEDFARDMDNFQKVRAESYFRAAVAEDELPATTYIQQPPCRRTQKLEMQIYAVVPKGPGSVLVRTDVDAATGTTAKLLEIAGVQHLYIADINGLPHDRPDPGTFREQSDRMFDHCRRLLHQYGIRFPDVLRTWCYLDDIDNTYADFNHSRNAFFATDGVKRLPASTGIEACLWPLSARCAMDLYAVLNPADVTAGVMHTPTLNEACEYGSSFSRGMKVESPDKTVLFISGTASIDERGVTVHVGDVRKQLERMLLNIQQLLTAQGASFADLAQAATFLKRTEYLELCELVLEEWGIRDVPNTFVKAGVCRPELLCEMEAVAVLPKR